jgi:hypothetical protein
MCVFTYTEDNHTLKRENKIWSTNFIVWVCLIVVVGRIIAVAFSQTLFMKCCKKDLKLNELIFITYGGTIRGAIAFGLVLKIPEQPDVFMERGVFITTTLAVVIFTTVGFGTFLKQLQLILFKDAQKNEDAHELKDSPLEKPQLAPIQEDSKEHDLSHSIDKLREQKTKSGNHRESHFENLIHPNDEEEVIDPDQPAPIGMDASIKQKGWRGMFARLDYNYLRPFLIYKYDKNKMRMQAKIHEQMEEDKHLVADIYENIDVNDLNSKYPGDKGAQAARVFEQVSQVTMNAMNPGLRESLKEYQKLRSREGS